MDSVWDAVDTGPEMKDEWVIEEAIPQRIDENWIQWPEAWCINALEQDGFRAMKPRALQQCMEIIKRWSHVRSPNWRLRYKNIHTQIILPEELT